MEIHRLGEGIPEVAVVGAIHGDEPCGVRAVERLRREIDPADLDRPVKLVVANEEALAAERRYVDEDLNRAFPGSPDADTHEGRLAHDIAREVQGCTVLALHSTQSYAEPFALVDTVSAVARSVAPRLPVAALIETGTHTNGRLIEHAHTIEAECGLQGTTEATDNAYWLTRAFLTATNVLAPPTAESPLAASTREEVPVFRLDDRIPKPDGDDYEVHVDNFERVEPGEPFASVGSETLTAEETFYPVLLSAHGYESQFGYAADRVGVVGDD
ncbi:MAG: succinylglutamate desuccinylase/aspartoacylase family protein [Halolamina sp.]